MVFSYVYKDRFVVQKKVKTVDQKFMVRVS